MLTVERLQSKIGKSVEFVEFLAPCHRPFSPQPRFVTRIYILPTGRFLESLVFLAITVFAQRHQCMLVADGQTDGQTALQGRTLPCNVRQKVYFPFVFTELLSFIVQALQGMSAWSPVTLVKMPRIFSTAC